MPIWPPFFSHPSCTLFWMKFRETESLTRIQIGLLWMTPIQVNIGHVPGWHQAEQKESHIDRTTYYQPRRKERTPWLAHVCINASICWGPQFVFEFYHNFKVIFILYCSAYSCRQEGVSVKKFRTIYELSRTNELLMWKLNLSLSLSMRRNSYYAQPPDYPLVDSKSPRK